MTANRVPALACLVSAVLFSGCYKSARTTSDHVGDESADTADDRDAVPDPPPDIPPDLLPDFDDEAPDYPPDQPTDFLPDTWTDVSDGENFCLGFTAGVCAYFTECCTDNERRELQALEMGCPEWVHDRLRLVCVIGYDNPITAGRVDIDFGAFADVLVELDAIATSCPDFGSSPFLKELSYRQWLAEALTGYSDEGERCAIDEECLDGLYCDVYTGQCADAVRIGGVCRDDSECGPGSVCNRGRCAEPQAEGGRCGDYEDCGVGLWCDGDACRDGLAPGAPCELEEMSCQGFCTLDLPMGACRDFCDGT